MTSRHGHRSNGKCSPTYNSWRMMRTRCLNKNFPRYNDYGGRGIWICNEWEEFTEFLREMGERPEDTTLDRIDNNKGYFKENCKWFTVKTQNLNKRSYINNKCGFTGASWRVSRKVYEANITVDNCCLYLGTFKTPEEAHLLYLMAKQELQTNGGNNE